LKSMTKTIFDYESSDEEQKSNPKKRTYKHHFDEYLEGQKSLISDIEKHCKNKRLKKNIYKMDYLKLINNKDQVYNPGVTNASSDIDKLPRVINDPVIDSCLRANNSLISDIMSHEGKQMIIDKGLHPENVFESDFCKTQKLADFEEFMASRRTSSSSPIGKNESFAGNSSVPTNISSENSFLGLPNAERHNLMQNLNFYKQEGKTFGYFSENMQQDFSRFRQTISMLQVSGNPKYGQTVNIPNK